MSPAPPNVVETERVHGPLTLSRTCTWPGALNWPNHPTRRSPGKTGSVRPGGSAAIRPAEHTPASQRDLAKTAPRMAAATRGGRAEVLFAGGPVPRLRPGRGRSRPAGSGAPGAGRAAGHQGREEALARVGRRGRPGVAGRPPTAPRGDLVQGAGARDAR